MQAARWASLRVGSPTIGAIGSEEATRVCWTRRSSASTSRGCRALLVRVGGWLAARRKFAQIRFQQDDPMLEEIVLALQQAARFLQEGKQPEGLPPLDELWTIQAQQFDVESSRRRQRLVTSGLLVEPVMGCVGIEDGMQQPTAMQPVRSVRMEIALVLLQRKQQ